MACAISTAPSILNNSSKSSSKISFPINFLSSSQISSCRSKAKTPSFHAHSSLIFKKRNYNFICRAEKEYKFPDPIPEFADSVSIISSILSCLKMVLFFSCSIETEKFKTHLSKKLSKKDMFGDSVDEVVEICTEIFNNFLHTEYGGPGTLLVIPFIDMADTLNERGLPGGPQAARAAVKWAQAHVDKDWKEWTST
ncbi:hypothetical protein DH2020_003527 [Rehmannia glutinosa]|uniref:Uncharacterized protein n=1 Tax=Rehmannia glutinosa TaxID=99300 RepID=A0ABR0XLV3_REHGL